MNALERLAKAGTNSVGQYSFIDADTIRDVDGTSYRLQGYDAPEIAGFKGGKWKAGTAGAADATRSITTLAESQGFTNLVKLKDADGNPLMDPNGRPVVELHNDRGDNFTTKLLQSGALAPGQYTSQEDLDAIDVAKIFGDQSAGSDEFGKAASEVQQAVANETNYETQFKQAALNEAAYAQGYGTAALSFRKTDRSLRNQAYNPMSDAWEQGWIGVKEGAYGMLSLIGDTTGSQWVEDVGEAGVARAQAQTQEYGEILTSYKDVNGFKTAMQYVGNNLALSLPYMVTTAGAAAAGTLAAPIIGTAGAIGIGVGAPATVYSGQVWNEMEGEKNAGIAVGAGLVQASLDRLGIGAIAGKVIPRRVLAIFSSIDGT